MSRRSDPPRRPVAPEELDRVMAAMRERGHRLLVDAAAEALDGEVPMQPVLGLGEEA